MPSSPAGCTIVTASLSGLLQKYHQTTSAQSERCCQSFNKTRLLFFTLASSQLQSRFQWRCWFINHLTTWLHNTSLICLQNINQIGLVDHQEAVTWWYRCCLSSMTNVLLLSVTVFLVYCYFHLLGFIFLFYCVFKCCCDTFLYLLYISGSPQLVPQKATGRWVDDQTQNMERS